LRAKVRRWTGLPVSVGIGPTKTLAKLANRWAKKNPRLNGVFDLAAARADEILARIECQDIWGIGRRTAAKLAKAGIRTARDLKLADIPWIRNELGVVGERIARELNGISCLAMEEVLASKKAIASARSFGHQVESIEEIQQALSTYIARVAEKLRAGKMLASRMEVFVETNPFKPESPQYHASAQATFMPPTDHTPALISKGLELLSKIYRQGFEYKKTGVMVTELIRKIPCRGRCLMRAAKTSKSIFNRSWINSTKSSAKTLSATLRWDAADLENAAGAKIKVLHHEVG